MKHINTKIKISLISAFITTALLSIDTGQAISAPERVNPQQTTPKRVNTQSAQ